MARSPITQVVEAFNALTMDEQMVFLDLVDPKPDEEEEKAEVKKSSKSKSPKPRILEHCVACDYTKRHQIHKDDKLVGHHEFVSSRAEKSKRALSIAKTINGTASRSVTGLPDGAGDGLLCTYEIDGKVCHGAESDGIHDKSMGYSGYHEFQAPLAEAGAGG